jgi:hypothetical protein
MFESEPKPEQAEAPGGIDRSLADQAAQIDGAAQPTEPGAAAAPAGPVDFTEEAEQLVTFACSALVPLYPSLGRVYTPDVQKALGGALGPLLAKYDLSLAGIFAKWAPELSFAMVAFPLMVPTIEAIKADRAARKADQAAPKPPAAAAAPGAAPAGGIPDVHNLADKA